MEYLVKPQIICHIEKSVSYSLFDAKWIPSSAKFVTFGSKPRGTGIIQIYEIADGELKVIKDIQHPNSIKCGTFRASNNSDRHFATGDFKGKLQIYDIENPAIPIYTANAHKEIINSIDGVAGNKIGMGPPELVTGSRDGAVKVWDPRQNDLPVATMEPNICEARRDCWTVAFGNSYNSEERIVVSGYDNGDIKMLDLKTMSLRWECNIKNGVCCLEFDRDDILMNKLVATTLESKFYVFDLRTQHRKKGFSYLCEKAHKSTVWLVRHLPQNRDIFATCGGGGSICLWKYKYPSKRRHLDSEGAEEGSMGTIHSLQNANLSSQPISSLNWSPEKLGLAVCTSFDQCLRVLITTKLNMC
ncbi:dynein axonemal assembly factor 10 [Leptopilina heterotoma]|uniref:dynein axonemal assembly factor 10 n=1 Tax=Leptopilina heterotoma TaxID=63436 RepID=UPI001CA93C9B|nr:dynein axonemal assembly factor 10 [Leptopilina heterotoma]